MAKTIILILILLMAMPVILAINEGYININDTYKQEDINGYMYYVYDDIKGDEIGIKAIYEGALGIIPKYNMKTETFRWSFVENILGFGKVVVMSLLRLTIDILKLIGKAVYEGVIV